ncbi:hypothetical protein G7Z17_g570 [Cylindrodendrum hubeiense]|uniref:Rhodopsin domain-containing protein n=1 Tax=Cylindrodendrum hubeiense TaxID=595255 RepID=A0A9P5LMY7_9HYPO|nr:hypothetical protein G7Z17_g570 [Cylindrodendrum hubeiense]
MPITEEDPAFLPEAWALYGIGTAIIFMRFGVRLKTVGWRGFQGDDFFSALVLLFYAIDAAVVHLIYFLGTNVEAAAQMKTETLSKQDLSDFTKGSKLEMVAWYSYTALIWSLKGTMLCFFSRMTIGTWHNTNWQVVPDPGSRCTFKMQNLVVTTVFNVLTDALILFIPMPLLWKLQVPLRKKIVISLLLSSGAFVIAAAIIRIVLTLSAHPSALTINSWGVRETLVGLITVNIPILRPMFNRNFWRWGKTPLSSSMNTGTGAGGRSTDITGPYELTPSINDATSKPREHGSQESIIGKNDVQNGVVVSTSFDISYKQAGDDSTASWYGGQRGANKASVRAGPNAV